MKSDECNNSKEKVQENVKENVNNSDKGWEAFRYAFPLTVPICASFLFLGISYGLYAVGQGLPWYLPVLMSATIFAGSMEFVTVALLAAPFDPLGAFVLAFMVNGRHIFYGLTMLTRYGPLDWKKYPLIYGLCDETFAINATINLPSQIDKGWFYLHVTWLNYLYWVGGVALGAVGSHFLTFDMKGIEFILTALFAVIFLDMLLTAKKYQSGLIGLAVALIMLYVLGPNLFILPAMLVMVLIFCGLFWWGAKDRREGEL